ncbi:MAG: purine-binding chemotaxis protein CheW [Deltaproteobacteria bacterium]|nr:purine-binding chemotaxis protein CheW [Deltaproteobacteria bacterium]MBN2672820.1 purine-binding chemotaxis protein CheW [Deltaproteobacteria bacterium]
MTTDSIVVTTSELTSLQPLSTDEPTIGFLCFMLGKEEFGVDLNLVSQIVTPPPVTRVPRTRSYFMGVVSIRGGVATLVDFRQLLGLDPAKIDRSSRILLYHTPDEQFGLLVDKVTLVRRVPASNFEENPVLEENPVTEKVVGVVRPDKTTQITIIDLEEIMHEALR